jgi:hypothetical protein
MVLIGPIIIAVVLMVLLLFGVGHPAEAAGAQCQPPCRTRQRPDSGAVTS